MTITSALKGSGLVVGDEIEFLLFCELLGKVEVVALLMEELYQEL
eukprot:CAMPEP_0194729192 /NCGR_PEP_ID=MMETSP0296-20130528/45449_1 /TAXON_ID=39354 /ORGANISM="Heterosigma akashiwo, Strain CCMP2393" /LENGTH=44 /DNA_ID= /DNA_START= /DNA_END= /DNA_ORIENTATION=